MKNIIRLLPDAICNQIAAGEVIQRPASVVKELLENSIDAKSTKIILSIEDGGKKVIQVIDNGIGMSDLDARMCLEKHATSKLSNIDDLLNIHTLGFRGEAIASIISISQVEIMTRFSDSDIGTRILVEKSLIQQQEPYVTSPGTNFIVRNIFFNIPVRREFLKDKYIETQHIVKVLHNIALAYPDVEFVFYNDNKELYHWYSTKNLLHRICEIFGEQYKKQLIACKNEDIHVSIEGYVCSPQNAKKYNHLQFIFVNGRHIKSSKIHQAIVSAYESFILKDREPFYFLFLTMNPRSIDVNIHPSKTEIKFYNEDLIFTFIKNTIKRTLIKSEIPEIDFENKEDLFLRYGEENEEQNSDNIVDDEQNNDNIVEEGRNIVMQENLDNIVDENDDLVESNTRQDAYKSNNVQYPQEDNVRGDEVRGDKVQEDNITNINRSYNSSQENNNTFVKGSDDTIIKKGSDENIKMQHIIKTYFVQVKPHFIITTVKSGVIVIHHRRAHIRILYERYLSQYSSEVNAKQLLLFPKGVVLNDIEYNICKDNIALLHDLGFGVEIKRNRELIITSLPKYIDVNYVGDVLEDVIACLQTKTEINILHSFAKIMAEKNAIKENILLSQDDMQNIINQLFLCKIPMYDLHGKKTYDIILTEDLQSRF